MLTALAVVIAQACWLEATYRTEDCAAIAHVILKRAASARVEPAVMAYAYSLNKPTPRAAQARALPAGLPARELPRWQALVRIAQGALEGRISNPCPRARHWGSPVLAPDVERAGRAIRQNRWVVVVCTRRTANTFYAHAAKRELRRRRT